MNPPPPGSPFTPQDDGCLTWRGTGERLTVTPWGEHGLRIRASRAGGTSASGFSALLEPSADGARDQADAFTFDSTRATVRRGRITAEISAGGRVRFCRSADGQELLNERPDHARRYRSAGPGGALDRLELSFEARAGERLYGLGQHQHGRLDQKGCVVDLSQRNTEVAVPFLVSSAGYGFLWNLPAVGRVELGRNGTRWVADAAPGFDYWITAGDSPADILEAYAGATGFPPPFPSWAAGFWQSRLRYATQAELLAVAREHVVARGLPLGVIVIDYFHWPAMGDWGFDPVAWPDPAGMVRELRALGVELMVSVWPTVNAASANFAEMDARGLLVGTERGVSALTRFVDTASDAPVYVHHYDATNPEARAYLWDRIRAGYGQHGIRAFWLDACEPELNPFDHDNLRYHAGNGAAVGCAFPALHQQAFHDGLTADGETEILTLCRSAWAGSQRFGAAVWSGDIPSTFASLAIQVRAGLNMAMSGIPWWTTDIGGFHGGDVDREEFRELIVRWFQYGVFCPVFRLHGVREPSTYKGGGANEVWSFGERAFGIIADLLRLRERLRPYVMEQMDLAHTRGLPPMRPLCFDFPDDPAAVAVDDQFLFGPDLLVAPVLTAGATARSVYLPAGAEWTEAWTGRRHAGGASLPMNAPLDTIPVFVKNHRRLPLLPPASRTTPDPATCHG